MKQLKFLEVKNNSLYYGGDVSLRKRKELRPLSFDKPLHLIIKPKNLERKYSFIKHKVEIQGLLFETARNFGIKIHEKSIGFTHIHLLLSFASREQYISFVRVFNSKLVKLMEEKAGHSFKGIFVCRPYTRVIQWGRDYQNMLKYITSNKLEAEGVRTPRFGWANH